MRIHFIHVCVGQDVTTYEVEAATPADAERIARERYSIPANAVIYKGL